MDEMIRILLVDDEAAVRQGLCMRLALEPDIEVVGEAEHGALALELARTLAPDIVLMDVQMAVMNGLSAAAELHDALPDTSVIMLTMHDDDKTRLMARFAGAGALVGKSQSDEALISTIRSIAAA
jgi:DNA-binding NarL/FixJ family response regulator